MQRTTGIVALVLLVGVVVVGAAVLGLPHTDGAVVAESDRSEAVRPPLRAHVVAARAAVQAERGARATRAAADVEAARVDAQARWERGDLPVSALELTLAGVLAAAMLRYARRTPG